MRIERQFSPMKLSLDTQDDVLFLLELTAFWEEQHLGKWYCRDNPSQKQKEFAGRVRYLRELLK